MRKVAFFDIDGTLYEGNLGFDVAKYLVGRRLFSRLVLFRGVFQALLYKFGLISYDRWGEIGLALINDSLAGRELGYVLQVVETFYDTHDLNFNKKVLVRLQELKDDNYFIVLVTGEPDFLIRPFISRVGADTSITSEMELDKKGNFTGKILENLATNTGKKKAFERFVESENVDLANSIAFGDTEGDLGMLEAVGKAVCVSPSKRLRKKALEREWEIIE